MLSVWAQWWQAVGGPRDKIWIGLNLFNGNTRPSGHISRPTQVSVCQSCFNSLNKLLKLNYVVQVWGLVEVNCVISDRRIPLLAGIPQCMSRELSRRGYSMSQLCSIRHDIPVPLRSPEAYDQCWVFDHSWLDWICLTAGHISRPTQVNVSQSCFHSLNNYWSLIVLYTSGG